MLTLFFFFFLRMKNYDSASFPCGHQASKGWNAHKHLSCYSFTHLLVLRMFELAHLHSLLSPKTSQKNKKLMDICLSERGIKVTPFKIKMESVHLPKNFSFPQWWITLWIWQERYSVHPSLLASSSVFIFFYSTNLLFAVTFLWHFQKWSFRIFIHIVLNWNWSHMINQVPFTWCGLSK